MIDRRSRARHACALAMLLLLSGAPVAHAVVDRAAPVFGPWGELRATCDHTSHGGFASKQVLAQSIEWTELQPAVVPANRFLPVTLLVKIDAGPVTSVRLELTNGGGNITLSDNGVAPDATAGDLVFTANIPMAEITARNTPDRQGRPILGFIQPLNGATPVGTRSFQLGLVAPTNATPWPVTTHNANERSTAHVYNVRRDNFFNPASAEFGDPAQASTALIARFGDRYDFIDFIHAPRERRANRFHSVVRTDATGLGGPIVNAGASFGSPARLIGWTMFPILSISGFSTGYNHEVAHQWINRVGGALADPLSGGHWPLSPLAQSVMGWSGPAAPPQGVSLGCQITRNGSTVTLVFQGQLRNFNDFELYLMGAIPAASVAPSFVFADNAAAVARINGNCSGTATLATTTVDASTIVALHGARSPSAATSRKYFNVATVVISGGRTLDDTELRWITDEARKVMQPGFVDTAEGLVTVQAVPTFSTATGGRMSLDTRLDGTFNNGFE